MQVLSKEKDYLGLGVKLLLKDNNLSVKALAEEINVSDTTLFRLIKGQVSPNATLLYKLRTRFGVSVDALMFGIDGKPAYRHEAVGRPRLPIIDAFASDSMEIEDFKDDLYQGFDVFFRPDFPTEEQWYGQIGVRINGDSMNPHLHHGDIVIANRLRADDEFIDGKVYMVQARGIQPSAKRVQVHAQDRSMLELHSDSGTLPPRLIPKDDVVALWRISRTITDWGLR